MALAGRAAPKIKGSGSPENPFEQLEVGQDLKPHPSVSSWIHSVAFPNAFCPV